MSKVTLEQFAKICRANELPEPSSEVRFNPERRWRFDFTFDGNIAIEIDGGTWIQGKHSRGAGQLADWEKRNWAACNGWIVLVFSPKQITSGEFVATVKDALMTRAIEENVWANARIGPEPPADSPEAIVPG